MLDPIHPFPARMAPEIAFSFLEELPTGSLVLDPMCGSGVSLRSAVENNHRAIGNDADPLAVLMSSVWTNSHKHTRLPEYASEIVAKALRRGNPRVPWQSDDETNDFVRFWFGKKQADDLSRISMSLHQSRDLPLYVRRGLQLAISRMIVTKTRGASLAWDVSHSRPHRKKTAKDNDFDVMSEFIRASQILSNKLKHNSRSWQSRVMRGDARKLRLPDQHVDAIITSPPYLNAIDYMRGHRLALVWLGHSIPELRTVRTKSIGTEKSHRPSAAERFVRNHSLAPGETQRLVEQYLRDIGMFAREIKRVAKKRAPVCIITANSNIRGTEIHTNLLVQAAAEGAGLSFLGEKVRLIEQSKRYLPTNIRGNALNARMMEEHIQYFTA
jgi:hypothetical protein